MGSLAARRFVPDFRGFAVVLGVLVGVAPASANTSGVELCAAIKQGLADCLSEAKTSTLSPRQCPETKKTAARAYSRAMDTATEAQRPVFEHLYGLWLDSADHVDPASRGADEAKLRDEMIELFRTCYGLENANP
jgi:hypothetical protein